MEPVWLPKILRPQEVETVNVALQFLTKKSYLLILSGFRNGEIPVVAFSRLLSQKKLRIHQWIFFYFNFPFYFAYLLAIYNWAYVWYISDAQWNTEREKPSGTGDSLSQSPMQYISTVCKGWRRAQTCQWTEPIYIILYVNGNWKAMIKVFFYFFFYSRDSFLFTSTKFILHL